MCGLIGDYGKLSERAAFQKLLDLSDSRGPDDQEIVEVDDCIRLGFYRLAILDLTDAG